MIISACNAGRTIRDFQREPFYPFATRTSLPGAKTESEMSRPIRQGTADRSSQTDIASLPSEPRNLPIFYDSLQANAGNLFQSTGNIITKRFGSLAIFGREGRIFAITDSQNPALGFSQHRFPQPHFLYRNGGAASVPFTGATDLEIATIDLVKRAALQFASPPPLGLQLF